MGCTEVSAHIDLMSPSNVGAGTDREYRCPNAGFPFPPLVWPPAAPDSTPVARVLAKWPAFWPELLRDILRLRSSGVRRSLSELGRKSSRSSSSTASSAPRVTLCLAPENSSYSMLISYSPRLPSPFILERCWDTDDETCALKRPLYELGPMLELGSCVSGRVLRPPIMARPLPKLAAMPPLVEYDDDMNSVWVPGAENGEEESLPTLLFDGEELSWGAARWEWFRGEVPGEKVVPLPRMGEVG